MIFRGRVGKSSTRHYACRIVRGRGAGEHNSILPCWDSVTQPEPHGGQQQARVTGLRSADFDVRVASKALHGIRTTIVFFCISFPMTLLGLRERCLVKVSLHGLPYLHTSCQESPMASALTLSRITELERLPGPQASCRVSAVLSE